MAENKSFWARLLEALIAALKDAFGSDPKPEDPPVTPPVQPPVPPVEPPVTPDPPPVVEPPPVQPPTPPQPPVKPTIRRVGLMRPQGGLELKRGQQALVRIEVEYSDGNVLRGGEGLKGVTNAVWRAQAGGQVASIGPGGSVGALGFGFGPLIYDSDEGAAANLKTTATAPAGPCIVACRFILDGREWRPEIKLTIV